MLAIISNADLKVGTTSWLDADLKVGTTTSCSNADYVVVPTPTEDRHYDIVLRPCVFGARRRRHVVGVTAVDVNTVDVTTVDVTAVDVAAVDVTAVHVAAVDVTVVDVTVVLTFRSASRPTKSWSRSS